MRIIAQIVLITIAFLSVFEIKAQTALDAKPSFIKVRTPEGLHHIKIWPVKRSNTNYSINGAKTGSSFDMPLFFKGKVRNKRNRKAIFDGVGGSLINNVLTLDFYGHRKRLFKANININTKAQQLSHAPMYLKLTCGSNQNLDSLIAETRDNFSAIGALPAFSPGFVAELATDADREYYLVNSGSASQTFAAIAHVINSVNSIYLADIGLQFNLTSQNVFTVSSSQPYTSSEADVLLSQFSNYTNSNSHINGDIKHLFTGKDIKYAGNFSVAGLAWIGTVCSVPEFSYGLSEGRSAMTSLLHLIVAHEIGHNFNAEHTSTGLMSAVLNLSQTSFSANSVDQISSYISANNQCLSLAPSVGDLKLTLSKRKAKLKTSITPLRSVSACSVSLYGAKSKAALAADFATATEIFRTTGQDLQKISAKTKILGVRPAKNVYFRAVADCGAVDYYSSIVRLKKEAGEGSNVSVKKFLRKVARLIKVNPA